MAQTGHHQEKRIIVVGVGLIGGSIAAATRRRFPEAEVIGIGRNRTRLEAAKKSGLLTSFQTQLTQDLLSRPAVVVVCLPVNLIADEVCRIAEIASAETLITDAGSVKGTICSAVARHPKGKKYFVGAHPIAGGEQGGFEFADADLFAGKNCIIVNSDNPALNQRTELFWRSLGCHIVTMTARQHDEKLALTSHLPHIMAAITTSAVGPHNLSLTGSGFKDTTRIAAGSSSLWMHILSENRTEVVSALSAAEELLIQYRNALSSGDDSAVEQLLEQAAACRNQLD